MKKNKSLILYLISVALSSAVLIQTAILFNKTANIVAAFYMLTPALSAIFVRIFFYENKFSDACLSFGKWKWYFQAWTAGVLISLLFSIAYILSGSASLDFTGQGFIEQIDHYSSENYEEMIRDIPAGMSLVSVLLLYTIGGLTIFNIPGIILGFGEEFGWRGFMFPLLYKINPAFAFLGGGLIWFLWHIPLTFLSPQLPDFTSWHFLMKMFILCIGGICTFILFAYIFAIYRNIWIPSLFHITMNNSSRALSYWMMYENQEIANLMIMMVMSILVGLLWITGRFKVFREQAAESQNLSPGTP